MSDDNNDDIRSLTRADVLELVEWMDAESGRLKESKYWRAGRGIDAALAKLREIAARSVLDWTERHGNSLAEVCSCCGYECLQEADGTWAAYMSPDYRLTSGLATSDAAKAACEAHARGQG